MNFLRMLSVLMVVVVLMVAVTEAGPLFFRRRGNGGFRRRGRVNDGISLIYGDTYAAHAAGNSILPGGVFNQIGLYNF